MSRVRRFFHHKRDNPKTRDATENVADANFAAISLDLLKHVEKSLRPIQNVFDVSIEGETLTAKLKQSGGGFYSLEIDNDRKCLFFRSPISGRSTYVFSGKEWISPDGRNFLELFARELANHYGHNLELRPLFHDRREQDRSSEVVDNTKEDFAVRSHYLLKSVEKVIRSIQDTRDVFGVSADKDILTIKLKRGAGLYSMEIDNDNKCLFFLSPISGRSTYVLAGEQWVSHDGKNFIELFARELTGLCNGSLHLQ